MRDANINVDFQTGMAYDPAWIVVNMLKKIGPDATALQMRDYLNNLKGFAGTSGVYDFTTGNQHGIDLKDILVMRWDPTRNTWYTVSQFGGAPLK
jgi:branched-chain amino acid transport system substrate-binding protein